MLFQDSQTPLYAASKAGHENVVKLLLQSGADVNRSDEVKST